MSSETQTIPERTFTERELQKYNGERGRPVYIAYAGLVYDVTTSTLWRSGMHKNLHYSGIDLTRSLPKAPHGAEVFARWPVVGRLVS